MQTYGTINQKKDLVHVDWKYFDFYVIVLTILAENDTFCLN